MRKERGVLPLKTIRNIAAWGAVAEVIVRTTNSHGVIAVNDTFGESGKGPELFDKYGICLFQLMLLKGF
jgi:hypothetical protein